MAGGLSAGAPGLSARAPWCVTGRAAALPLRVRAVLFTLIALASLPGCESCEFTYGSIEVTGTVVIKGPEPADLRIELCAGPDRETCGDTPEGYLGNGADGRYQYTAYIPSEGTWTCGFNRHWIVVTGTGCTEAAVDALASGNGSAEETDVALDLELHCALAM